MCWAVERHDVVGQLVRDGTCHVAAILVWAEVCAFPMEKSEEWNLGTLWCLRKMVCRKPFCYIRWIIVACEEVQSLRTPAVKRYDSIYVNSRSLRRNLASLTNHHFSSSLLTCAHNASRYAIFTRAFPAFSLLTEVKTLKAHRRSLYNG